MTTPILTVAHLTRAGACPEQVALFRKTFPKGAPLLVASLRTANKAGLHVAWLSVFLDFPAWAEYNKVRGPALAEYDKVCDAAWAEYDKVCDAAWAERDKVRGPALAEYAKVCGAAWAEYDKVCDAAWAERDKVCGPALVAGLRATFRRAAKVAR